MEDPKQSKISAVSLIGYDVSEEPDSFVRRWSYDAANSMSLWQKARHVYWITLLGPVLAQQVGNVASTIAAGRRDGASGLPHFCSNKGYRGLAESELFAQDPRVKRIASVLLNPKSLRCWPRSAMFSEIISVWYGTGGRGSLLGGVVVVLAVDKAVP